MATCIRCVQRTPDRTLGPASSDPWANLAQAVIFQAVHDLASSDLVQKWDALLWFSNPGAADLMQFAGINVDPLYWLTVSKR